MAINLELNIGNQVREKGRSFGVDAIQKPINRKRAMFSHMNGHDVLLCAIDGDSPNLKIHDRRTSIWYEYPTLNGISGVTRIIIGMIPYHGIGLGANDFVVVGSDMSVIWFHHE